MRDAVELLDFVRPLLDRAGWTVETGKWCVARPPVRSVQRQGWKLHISATPLSAPLVVVRSVEVLLRHGCAFKFAPTIAAVQDLVSAQIARGAGGKVITAYPECDLTELAEDLHLATEGLPGPAILSDRPYRRGSLVHYRFGAFTGVRMLGNDGAYEAMLVTPEGRLVQDRREAWFTPPVWAPPDPFATQEAPDTKPGAVLLNDRYLVRDAIRHSFTGGVYRARDERTGADVVIKQARPHTGATLTGQDVRDLRRHEAELLTRFAPTGVTPRLVELFEQQGELFLVEEAIAGTTLHRWVARHLGSPETVELAVGLVGLVELVHGKGLLLRDFNPGNVMVTDAGELRLIDLELLVPVGERGRRAFTAGYAAPEQVAGLPIDVSADLYSLGATLFFLVSGIVPLLAQDNRGVQDRLAHWLGHIDNAAARRLAPIIIRLLDDDPARRPSLDQVRSFLSTENSPVVRSPCPDLTRLITDGIEHLVATMDPGGDRLWFPSDYGSTMDPVNVQHGAAGVLGVLTRASLGTAATAARWIVRRAQSEPRSLPGLYFGRSGTSWALLEAGHALGDKELIASALDMARRVPVRWPHPDICHGAAGAGMTQLRCWEISGDEDFLDRARQAADGLVEVAEHLDGQVLWPVPLDFDSTMAGLVHYGFAHGVAGIGAFLLAAGRATGTSTYLDLAGRAARTLVAVARLDDGAAYWPDGPRGGPLKSTWCSGASGVGTFLVRMWQHGGDEEFGDLARKAAVAVRRSRWIVGTTQCHGLAGDGEFLLDLADVTGEPQYRAWAEELAVALHVRNTLQNGRMVVPAETGTAVVADFSTGLSGVLAFLLRLRDGGCRLWLPDSFTGRSVPGLCPPRLGVARARVPG